MTSPTDTLRAALAADPTLCQRHRVTADTVIRVVREFPGVATMATKYDATVRNETIAAQLGMSVRTVQRARRVLEEITETAQS